MNALRAQPPVRYDRRAVWAVLNPAAKGYQRARAVLLRGCRDAGLGPPQILTTTRERPGADQARQALQAGASLVVVGGGDGTVREVAQALAGSDVALGILPLGTANLFAHNLGLRTRDIARAVDHALSGAPLAIDVGRASWRPVVHGVTRPPSREEVFLVMAGIGHDAATVLATGGEVKARLGWLAYLTAGARYLVARPLPMRISLDASPARRIRAWSVLVANCGRIPGGIHVFPNANPADGVLDTLEVPIRTPWAWGSVAAKGLLRLRRDVVSLRYDSARTVWVIPDAPAPLQLDGDVIERVADLWVRVDPGALTVRVPLPRAGNGSGGA